MGARHNRIKTDGGLFDIMPHISQFTTYTALHAGFGVDRSALAVDTGYGDRFKRRHPEINNI